MNKADLNKKLGKKIEEFRNKKGWSQTDLANACGKDKQVIQRIESGAGNPTIYTLYEVAQALGVNVGELVRV